MIFGGLGGDFLNENAPVNGSDAWAGPVGRLVSKFGLGKWRC